MKKYISESEHVQKHKQRYHQQSKAWQLSEDSSSVLVSLKLDVRSAYLVPMSFPIQCSFPSEKDKCSDVTNSSSQKTPFHSILNQFLLKLCKQITAIVIGSVTMAKGKECPISISISIHVKEPKQNDTRPISRYMLVDLLTSNLLRYDSNSPGNSILVIGNQAHCLQSQRVMEGITRIFGFWNMLITQLLQDVLNTQWMNMPTVAYRINKLSVSNTAIHSDLIFSSFIRATTEHIAIMSLTSHWPFSNQYRGMNSNPEPIDIKSISLIFLRIFIRMLDLLKSHSSSERQTATPAAPMREPATLATKETTPGWAYPTTIPKNTMTLNPAISLFLISYPQSSQDQARLYLALRVTVIEQSIISKSRPISNGLQMTSGLQLVRYQTSPISVSILILLTWLPYPHRLSTVIRQSPSLQDKYDSMGYHNPWIDEIAMSWDYIMQPLWVLSAKMNS